MLTFSFFTAVFLTLSWLMYMGTYLYARLGGIAPSGLGLTDLVVYTAVTTVPLFLIWMIWGAFYRFRHEGNLRRQLKGMELQIRQNQELSALSARLFYHAEQNRRNYFILGQTELFIGELNGLLADMLQRYNFISDSDTAKLWDTAGKGNKWGFARTLINLENTGVDFENRLYRRAVRETMLRGTINEFCARYARLLDLLKAHDQEKIFLNIIETGSFGKAFAILATVADRLQESDKQEETDEPELFAADELLSSKPETGETEPEDNSVGAGQTAPSVAEEENPSQTSPTAAEEKNAAAEINAPASEEKNVKKDQETADNDISLEEEISRMFAGAGVRGDENEEEKTDSSGKMPLFPKFANLFKRKKKKEKDYVPDGGIDPLTLALERSFGKLSDTAPVTASRLYKVLNEGEKDGGDAENREKFAFTGTNETILKLQQELEKLKNPDARREESEPEKDAEKSA